MRGRITRAMKQKMFVLSRELDSQDESVENFEVLGSVGNVSRILQKTFVSLSVLN
jgi:hypothetical protein